MAIRNWLFGPRKQNVPSPNAEPSPSPTTSTACADYVSAFCNRDYPLCIKLFPELMKLDPNFFQFYLLPFQLFLISTQRAGLSQVAEHFANNLISNRESASTLTPRLKPFVDFDNDLIKLTLGRIELHDVLATAINDHQRCEAYYYAGERMITIGEHEKARAEFERCLSIQANSEVRKLAELERQNVLSSSAQRNSNRPEQ